MRVAQNLSLPPYRGCGLIPRPCLGTRLRDGTASLPVDVVDCDLIDFVWLSLHCLERGEGFAELNILCCCERQMNVLQGGGPERGGVGGGRGQRIGREEVGGEQMQRSNYMLVTLCLSML